LRWKGKKVDVNVLNETKSLCPECLERMPAQVIRIGDEIHLVKECRLHGRFSTLIWREHETLHYGDWNQPDSREFKDSPITDTSQGCPYDCGLCPDHRQQTCCVLIEVTHRCNLTCNYCFARQTQHVPPDPSFEEILDGFQFLALRQLPNIQLSGGEPTLRPDLPEIIAAAKKMEFSHVQLNTNGLRLGMEKGYAQNLADQGLSCVFLQFDGVSDGIYQKLRGCRLLETKKTAVENCGAAGLGVVLVPTLVPGVNTDQIGRIIDYAASRSPVVTGVHFQPVSFLGHYPQPPDNQGRITLPDVLLQIEQQTHGRFQTGHFSPSGSKHPLCTFHGNFVIMPDGKIAVLSSEPGEKQCCANKDSRQPVQIDQSFIARSWTRKPSDHNFFRTADTPGMGEWEILLDRIHTHGFVISGMAFQDRWNIDLERLQRCSLHVLTRDHRLVPFCSYYSNPKQQRKPS
jgi:7,8-dihydro-6-hydroxymethylpterin dimethyltransferase